MPRIRTVKPELFRHEELFQAEKDYCLPLRLAFIGLFTCCDREGRFRWRPRLLKLDILPFDDIDFSKVLNSLAERGFIKKYSYEGNDYGFIPSWPRHQLINNKEQQSLLPEPYICQVSERTYNSNKNYTSSREGTENLETENFITSDQVLDNDNNLSTTVTIEVNKNIDLSANVLEEFYLDEKNNTSCSTESQILRTHRQKSKLNDTPSTRASRVAHALTTRNQDEISLLGNSYGEKERKGNMEKEKEHEMNFAQDKEEASGCSFEKKSSIVLNVKAKTKKQQRETTMSLSSQVQKIFDCWRQTMKQAYAKLDDNRLKIILNSLKIGYTENELCQAILGCAETPYNMGQNNRGEIFNGLHVIFRDAHQIDRFIRHFNHPPINPMVAPKMQQNLVAVQRWLKKKTFAR